MALELKYNANLAGAKALSLNDDAVITDQVWDKGKYSWIRNGYYLILTGYYYYDGHTTNYLQTDSGWFIVSDTYEGTDEYWKITEGAEKPHTYTQSQAQALVQKIITNNKIITRCNCLCARYGGRFTSEELAQIKALQQRVMQRNKALQDEGLLKDVKTGYPEEYEELSPYLHKIMEYGTMGIGITTWVVVVIAATVIAATATAAYFAYKNLADESERDVKYSKALTQTLVSKLTEEEYQQLLNETKGMLTKSKIKSLVRGSWGTIKYAAIIVGGYAIYKIIKSKL